MNQRRVFFSSKALKSVLNVLTLKVPTLTRRCFLRFTTLRLATDSEEVMICRDRYLRLLTCFSTSHIMMNHVCF